MSNWPSGTMPGQDPSQSGTHQPRRESQSPQRAWLRQGAAILLLPPMLGLTPALAESDAWTPAYNQDAIQVQTRPVVGSEIRAFRAQIDIAAPVDSILAVMGDPKACPDWVHGCKEARILNSTGFYQRNTYQVNDMPWPVQDRDLVLEVRIEELSGGAFRLSMINHPEAYPLADYVRIQQASGYYLLTPTPDGHTRVEWEQHTDPGGDLPAWLINQLIVDVPVETLKHLRTLATHSPYIDQRFKRDKTGQILGWTPLESQTQALGVL